VSAFFAKWEEWAADLLESHISYPVLAVEPYVNALSENLSLPLPRWVPIPGARDNWQKSKWD